MVLITDKVLENEGIVAFFICGFTGSGKSTLLQKLQSDPACGKAIDLDDYIFDLHADDRDSDLGSYIRRVGFEKFREVEKNCIHTLATLLGPNDVVALGGGSLEEKSSLDIIKFNRHLLVWLNMSFETCMKRVEGDRNRPLLEKSRDELEQIYLRRAETFKMSQIQLCSKDVDAVRSLSALKTLVH
ncbi:shikimate kinase [Bacteriovorax sp. BSW11_IV]|uniref:shikimate kinase n=1 Tax=Bacteriovorax sp. BSW11_IV TaxID=1353529 RepID=UPI00038A4CDA|nr:shikimate kinase [Bacteriovorax sp. BSW11_IV]EQC50126.1 shikimate kinase [Bacteriovorax sp. BSW11_IV]